jgi:serine/threonine-protein kinase
MSAEFLDLQEAVAGRYSLDREIGRGGMGVVFLARDVALDRPVAIKLFPPAFGRDAELRARFLQEARTAAKLSHPNIVPIHAVEEHDDLVFFVMSYIDGQTLTTRLQRSGPLTVRDAAKVLRETAWALAHAHAQGVIHRDIKADNILIEDGSGRAVVTDFGIAVVASDADVTGTVIGTPEFMSPEQIRGDVVDARTDLYALGVVGFLLLSGRYPFPTGSPNEVMAHHLGTPAPRLATVAPGVPTALGDLIDRCLCKDRDERLASAADLADRLAAGLEARPDVPVPVRHFVEELKRRGERSPVLMGAVAFFILGPASMSLMISAPFGAVVGPALVLGGLLAVPAGGLIQRARRVLRAGYDREDVLRALWKDLESQQEELVFLYGKDYRRDAKRLRIVALSSFAGTFAGLAGLGASVAPLPTFVVTSGFLATAVVTGLRSDRRSDKRARRRWRFWKGKIGAWLFKVSRLGLSRHALPSTALTARPTEVSVGAAALSLYESLPTETRRHLSDTPVVVRDLEQEAHRMRALMEQCDAALDEVGSRKGATAGGADHRERLHVLRARAQQRMQDAVAALETLRIDLLRLSAGTVELTSVTTRLGNARKLAVEVERMLDAQREVQALLDGD